MLQNDLYYFSKNPLKHLRKIPRSKNLNFITIVLEVAGHSLVSDLKASPCNIHFKFPPMRVDWEIKHSKSIPDHVQEDQRQNFIENYSGSKNESVEHIPLMIHYTQRFFFSCD